MADRRRPSRTHAPANSRLRESCLRRAAAGGATVLSCVMWWTASFLRGHKSQTRNREKNGVTYEFSQGTTIARTIGGNSSDIHRFAMHMQHAGGNVRSSSCPSNREG